MTCYYRSGNIIRTGTSMQSCHLNYSLNCCYRKQISDQSRDFDSTVLPIRKACSLKSRMWVGVSRVKSESTAVLLKTAVAIDFHQLLLSTTISFSGMHKNHDFYLKWLIPRPPVKPAHLPSISFPEPSRKRKTKHRGKENAPNAHTHAANCILGLFHTLCT